MCAFASGSFPKNLSRIVGSDHGRVVQRSVRRKETLQGSGFNASLAKLTGGTVGRGEALDLIAMVDVEGYVTVNSNRYSVPVDWIGRRVEVRATSSKIEIQLDARHLVTHQQVKHFGIMRRSSI
jgi:hypothetical protein